jgi:hypothetical protein
MKVPGILSGVLTIRSLMHQVHADPEEGAEDAADAARQDAKAAAAQIQAGLSGLPLTSRAQKS